MNKLGNRRRQKEPNLAAIFDGAPGPLQRIVRDQRVLFLLVGGVNTLAATALFAVLVLLYGDQVSATAILIVVWVISLLAVFMIYRRLVFRVKGRFWLQLMKFTVVNLAGLVINAGLLAVFADYLGWPPIPVQLSVMAFIIVLNYFSHLHFSFREKERP